MAPQHDASLRPCPGASPDRRPDPVAPRDSEQRPDAVVLPRNCLHRVRSRAGFECQRRGVEPLLRRPRRPVETIGEKSLSAGITAGKA